MAQPAVHQAVLEVGEAVHDLGEPCRGIEALCLAAVERGEAGCDGRQVALIEPGRLPVERPRRRQPSHDDHGIDSAAGSAESQRPRLGQHQVLDAEIDVPGERSVERHLGRARMAAPLRRREVEPFGPDRLLQLADHPVAEKDPREMRLDHGDSPRPLRMARRPAQERHLAAEVGITFHCQPYCHRLRQSSRAGARGSHRSAVATAGVLGREGPPW